MIFVTPERTARSGGAEERHRLGARTLGQNIWAGKTGGIIGTSPSAVRHSIAQQHLRAVLAAEGVNSAGLAEVFLQMPRKA